MALTPSSTPTISPELWTARDYTDYFSVDFGKSEVV